MKSASCRRTLGRDMQQLKVAAGDRGVGFACSVGSPGAAQL